MKSSEFITESKDLDKLKTAIAAGAAPAINNATYTSDGYSWGDLQSLGLASRDWENVGRDVRREWWIYSKNAPGPITLVTAGNAGGKKIMNPGDKTSPVEVDYS